MAPYRKGDVLTWSEHHDCEEELFLNNRMVICKVVDLRRELAPDINGNLKERYHVDVECIKDTGGMIETGRMFDMRVGDPNWKMHIPDEDKALGVVGVHEND